jgi:hypothetical protein
MKKWLCLLLIVSFGLLAQEFKTSKAKEALTNYQTEIKKIEALKQKAKEKYKKDLTDALSAAMKAGNLEESVLINSVLEKDLADEPKDAAETKAPKGKLKEPIVLVDNHGSWFHTKDGSNAGNYKFDIQTVARKYTLKVYTTTKEFTMDILMTGGKQTLTNIGTLKADPTGFSIDVTSFIKVKGPYTFLGQLKKPGPDIIDVSKMEIIIE